MDLPCHTGRGRRKACWWQLALLVLLNLAAALSGASATTAYLADGGQAGGALLTGSFATLMTLEPGSDPIVLVGREGEGFAHSLTVTSRAGVALPMAVSWDGPAPPGAELSLSDSHIRPGQSLTVTLQGTYTSSTETHLKIAIGQAYDWALIPVSFTALSWRIDDLIRIEPVADVFYSGTAAPKFAELLVAHVYATAGSPSLELRISQDPVDTEPVTLDTPPVPFRPAAQGTEIRVSQEWAEHRRPTQVTITVTGHDPWVHGSMQVTFVLAHSGDRNPDPGENTHDVTEVPHAQADFVGP
jgi:hypothetical protein